MIDALRATLRAWGFRPSWVVAAGWAAVGLAAAARSARDRAHRRPWLAAALVAALLAADLALSARYALGEALRSAVRGVGGAAALRGRRPVQAGLVLAALAATAGGLAASFARWRAAPAPLLRTALGLGLGGLGVLLEVISLHQIDAHPAIYWAIRLFGLALAATGPIAARPGSRPEPRGHARYAVSALAARPGRPRWPPSGPLWLLLALALAGLIALAARLLG